MNQERFRGLGVATITPFKDGKIDIPALEKIIDFQVSGGVDYLVCLGTTGEATTLTKQEKDTVIELTKSVNAQRVPIMLGTFGGNDTAAIIRSFDAYDLNGIDGFLSASPAYNKPPQRGVVAHYQALSAATPLPIVVYNVPGRTACNLTVETTVQISDTCPQVIGIKEASGDLIQGGKIIKHTRPDFLVLSGDDETALPLMAIGGDGVISVIANVYPKYFTDMTTAALEGDLEKAVKIHMDLVDVHPYLYDEGNPAGIKGAMEIKKFCSREVRLPLMALTEKSMQGLRKSMEEVPSES